MSLGVNLILIYKHGRMADVGLADLVAWFCLIQPTHLSSKQVGLRGDDYRGTISLAELRNTAKRLRK